HLQKHRVVSEIDRRLGGELEWVIVRALPRSELGQESLERLLVAYEIIIDEIDMTAVPEPVECIELGEHLLRHLGARHPSVKLYDVAELASEWTSARILHADIEIVIEF